MSSRKIAVCVDGSEPSTNAWKWALSMLCRSTDVITLLAVAPTVNFAAASLQPPMVSGTAVQALIDANHQETEELKDSLEAITKEAKGFSVGYALIPPSHGVGQDLVDHINAEKYDHVILGNRGLGAFKRSLLTVIGLGSVSDYVLHHCHCPVTIVKPHES